MSRHHANTTNPKYIKMQQDYARTASEYGTRNSFLMGLIEMTRTGSHIGDRRVGYREATLLMDMFDEIGYTETLRNESDLQDPNVFWNLMDIAKKNQIKSGEGRAVRAVNFLYERLDKAGLLTETFKTAEKSPFIFLRKNSFLKKLLTEYTCSKDVFIINYSFIHYPVMLILPYKNESLRKLVVDAFVRDQSRYTISQKDAKELCNMEEIFGPYAETIRSIDDLNASVLTFAKDTIMKKYTDNLDLRKKYMKHLWCIFRHAVLSKPDKEFFKDSMMWNSTLILSHRVPSQVAEGYIPVIVEAYGSIPAYKKVLYVYTNGEYLGANGISYGMFATDYSCIQNELYRWLAVNYVAAKDERKHPFVTTFLSWLENVKNMPEYKYPKIDTVYADELCSFRMLIANKTRNRGSRNRYIEEVTSFLRWAAGCKKLQLQKRVFKYFESFPHRYVAMPHSLTKVKQKALESALLEMAQKDKRFYLTLNIFRITLRSDIRTGQLCSLDLSRMTWNDDGTSTYLSRVKNRGGTMVKTDFSRRVTLILRESIELTEDIRRDCPVEGPKTCLFLYRGLRPTDSEISVMNMQRYNHDLQKACNHAGIPSISSGNVRDTRMTAVAKFAHRHNLNEAQIATLTRHARHTSLNAYTDLHIEDLLTCAESVNLGSTND